MKVKWKIKSFSSFASDLAIIPDYHKGVVSYCIFQLFQERHTIDGGKPRETQKQSSKVHYLVLLVKVNGWRVRRTYLGIYSLLFWGTGVQENNLREAVSLYFYPVACSGSEWFWQCSLLYEFTQHPNNFSYVLPENFKWKFRIILPCSDKQVTSLPWFHWHLIVCRDTCFASKVPLTRQCHILMPRCHFCTIVADTQNAVQQLLGFLSLSLCYNIILLSLAGLKALWTATFLGNI